MYKLEAEVQGLPLPKQRQMEVLIDLLSAVQRNKAVVTGAVFDRGNIVIYAEVIH